ncbi:MAG: hypothetical protein H6862_03570 [Rhodospirillales bacterium]|nr:hypothetical protein [Rhodospirillales bacterium]
MGDEFTFAARFGSGNLAVIADGDDLYIMDDEGNELDFLSLLPRFNAPEDAQSGGSADAHLVCAPEI